jgi:hypothetical protein
MPVAAAVSLIGLAIVVFFLYVSLMRIIFVLREVSFNLGTIVALIRSIGRQSDSVPPVVASVNSALEPVRSTVNDLGRRFGNGKVVEMSR